MEGNKAGYLSIFREIREIMLAKLDARFQLSNEGAV